MRNDACVQTETGLPLSAVVLRTALEVLDVSAEEMAEAAGCDVDLVRRVASGQHDPVMDTLGRLVNVVGLELRCGARSAPNPAYLRVDADEVDRVAGALAGERRFWAQFGHGPPMPSHQTEWDGVPPAPPHLFGAGPTRRHGGGWAALVIGSRWDFPKTKSAEIAGAAGISEELLAAIETGEHRPPMSEVRRILNAAGVDLYVYLEVYEDHDDGLHHRSLEDPERLERTLAYNKKVFSEAAAVA